LAAAVDDADSLALALAELVDEFDELCEQAVRASEAITTPRRAAERVVEIFTMNLSFVGAKKVWGSGTSHRRARPNLKRGQGWPAGIALGIKLVRRERRC
jgi:hypothetical protein